MGNKKNNRSPRVQGWAGKAKKSGIPEKFLERLELIFGSSISAQIQKTFVERPTTFRVNTIKSTKENILTTLRGHGFQVEKVSWYKDAFVLKNKSKRELTELDIYKEGKIYIQSLASMLPPLILDPQSGDKILDLTAAPGSKTSQIAALMGKQGELIANDNNKVRFFKLKHNMEALGVADEKADWQFKLRMEHGAGLCKEYPEYFDKILLDAPCSAEARFVESEPKTYGFWHERKIKETAFKQRQLLFAAWQALKPGGTLIYSTCTFAPEENEVQISRLFEAVKGGCEILPIAFADLKKAPLVKNWKGKELAKEIQTCLHVLPDRNIEGFFVAKFKKITG